MIEEPYRWVEAIANRAEYIETQLASGSAIAAPSGSIRRDFDCDLVMVISRLAVAVGL